jgi:hypothetical protein
MNTENVKIGWLGMVGVDKRQRVVKMRHLSVLGTLTTYINVSVVGVQC